ncbi:MAG: FAD-dependent thymidylate synthase [Candidatus Andersenbacteria bacterium]|nr:FAD-dependent thymidylate synthase [Candidatus Andersenbacteria bacterium]MBI3250931.1 FAD-dependent thymidylate synthase [Candidatus Andersenbacteria bacterium]
MPKKLSHDDFAPPFEKDSYSSKDKKNLQLFFTNLDKPVYAPLIFSPEVIGALCSRTSRAAEDLRPIFLKEYIKPFLDDKSEYGDHLQAFIDFLKKHPIQDIFSNPRARSFYAKWLAQYGDDSIAQMAGMHVVYSGISQVAIKHFEDQRIGLAPIEKSTRYVDFSRKIDGGYMYYTDPSLKQMGLEKEYRAAMDSLFKTYISLLPKLQAWLQKKFPQEKAGVVEKKAFDTLRGLLPVSTLSQVAFFGNGQAFEYLAARSLRHSLGEIRWAAQETVDELYKITPSFLRRLKDKDGQENARAYQEYMAGRGDRVAEFVEEAELANTATSEAVKLVEYDSEGEEKIIAGMLYSAPNNNGSWEENMTAVRGMSDGKKRNIITAYLDGRTQRWQKVGRAFENAFVRFDISMNIGAWRDLHRHRMLSQQRQVFTVEHGYDTPIELKDSGFDKPYRKAIEKVEKVYVKIAKKDRILAQYAVAMAHRVRFMQYKNLRECFWEMELRTIPEGHPDYRKIEQDKFKLLEKVYPLITEHMRVNMGNYDFARRGQEEKIQEKLKSLERINI